jgi:hypothetical protein
MKTCKRCLACFAIVCLLGALAFAQRTAIVPTLAPPAPGLYNQGPLPPVYSDTESLYFYSLPAAFLSPVGGITVSCSTYASVPAQLLIYLGGQSVGGTGWTSPGPGTFDVQTTFFNAGATNRQWFHAVAVFYPNGGAPTTWDYSGTASVDTSQLQPLWCGAIFGGGSVTPQGFIVVHAQQ